MVKTPTLHGNWRAEHAKMIHGLEPGNLATTKGWDGNNIVLTRYCKCGTGGVGDSFKDCWWFLAVSRGMGNNP